MIADLKTYPEYRVLELPWLKEIPTSWNSLRGKSIFRLVDVRSKTGKEEMLTVSSNYGVIPRRQTSVTMFKAKSYIGHKLCWPGDLVVNSLWAWMQGLGVAQNHGLISSAYSVYRPRAEYSGYGRFFHYLFRSDAYKWEFQTRSKGVWISRLQLSDNAFMDLPVLLPPLHDQVAIVRFLDHVNRRIERTIRAKRKVISLLNEQKQVIIQQAVTHGTNSDWRYLPVRAVLRPIKRVCFPDKTLLSLFRDYGVIPKDSRENKNADVRDLSLCQLVKPGDVVMNKMKAWQGSIAVSSLEGIVSPDYMVLEFVCDGIVHKFFHYLLRSPSMITEYRRRAYGVRPGQWRLMYPDFSRLHLNVPPVHEQESIVSQVEAATANLERLISRNEREIGLLHEYRNRLISDVVTGKLDVREAVQHIPDELEEPIAADNEDLDEEVDADE